MKNVRKRHVWTTIMVPDSCRWHIFTLETICSRINCFLISLSRRRRFSAIGPSHSQYLKTENILRDNIVRMPWEWIMISFGYQLRPLNAKNPCTYKTNKRTHSRKIMLEMSASLLPSWFSAAKPFSRISSVDEFGPPRYLEAPLTVSDSSMSYFIMISLKMWLSITNSYMEPCFCYVCRPFGLHFHVPSGITIANRSTTGTLL